MPREKKKKKKEAREQQAPMIAQEFLLLTGHELQECFH